MEKLRAATGKQQRQESALSKLRTITRAPEQAAAPQPTDTARALPTPQMPRPPLPPEDISAPASSTDVNVVLPGQERKPDAPLREDVETLAGAVPRGALNAAATMVRGLDLMEDLDDPIARQQRVDASMRGETVPSKIANLIQAFAIMQFPADAEARKTFVNQTLEGLGSIAPYVAARLTPAGIPGLVAAGISAGEGQFLNEARAAGADASDVITDRSQIATILGGAIEAVPIERALGRLVPKAWQGRIVDVLLGTGEEGLQEGVQQITQNFAAQSFDEQRELLGGIKEAASVGGATGALLNTIIGVLGGRGVRMPGATTTETDEQGDSGDDTPGIATGPVGAENGRGAATAPPEPPIPVSEAEQAETVQQPPEEQVDVEQPQPPTPDQPAASGRAEKRTRHIKGQITRLQGLSAVSVKGGKVVLRKEQRDVGGVKHARKTTHFSSQPVSSHGAGDWSRATVGIVADYGSVVEENGDAVNADPADTFFYSTDEFVIPKDATVVVTTQEAHDIFANAGYNVELTDDLRGTLPKHITDPLDKRRAAEINAASSMGTVKTLKEGDFQPDSKIHFASVLSRAENEEAARLVFRDVQSWRDGLERIVSESGLTRDQIRAEEQKRTRSRFGDSQEEVNPQYQRALDSALGNIPGDSFANREYLQELLAMPEWMAEDVLSTVEGYSQEPGQVDQGDGAPAESRAVTEDEILDQTARESSDPEEIASAFLRAQELRQTGSPEEQVIADYFRDGHVSRSSFDEFSDPNIRRDDKVIGAIYLRGDAQSVDHVAQSLSLSSGLDVTPQQVVDFIERNPRGPAGFDRSRRHPAERSLSERFKEITGKPLTDKRAEEIIAQATADFTDDEGVILDEVSGILDNFAREDGIDFDGLSRYLDTDEGRGFFTSFPGGLTDAQYEQLKAEVAAEKAAGQRSEVARDQGTSEAEAAGEPGEGEAELTQPETLSSPAVEKSMATRAIDVALTDQALNKGRPISAPKVIESLAAVVQAAGGITPVRTGRMGAAGRRALGFFKVQQEVIRLRTADDIPVATHEVGHALEKAVYGWVSGTPFTGKNGLTRAMQQELEQLGHDLYGSQKPAGGYRREGFAEFVSYYVLTDEAAKKAPEFHKWFEGRFLKENPAVAEALETARRDASAWFQQGAVKRARASVAQKEPFTVRVREALKTERLDRWRRVLSRLFITEFQPLKTVTEEAERLKGDKLPIERNPFLTAEALAKTHAARVQTMVEDAMIDFTGTASGPSLRQAAAIVKRQKDEFTVYLWARRALKLWEGSAEKDARNPGLSKEDAQFIFETYDSREFRIAASLVHEWNEGVLKYASAAFGDEFADQIKTGDVGDYIPLQRVFDDLDSMGARAARRGKVKGRDPVKGLKGSGRRIRDPFEAMIENAERMVRATHERYIINQLVALKDVEGMGAYIEEVPRDKLPFAVSVERIADELDKMGFSVEFTGTGSFDMSKELAVFFSPAYAPKGQDPIIAAEQDGKIKWFQVDEELYRSLSGLDIYRLPIVLDIMFGIPTRLFRLGTTGIRAAFTLVTNPLRDVQTLYAQSLSSANPAQMAAAFFQSLKAGVEYQVTDNLDRDPHFAAFYRLGGEIAQPLGQDINATRRAVRELFQGRAVRTIDPRNWIDLLRDVLQIPESAARVSEIRLMAKEAGWTPGTPMNENQALSLLLAAKRVTVDFSSQGQFAKVMNQMIPFVTSNIGGQRAFLRAFKTNPKRAMIYAGSLVAMSLAYWWQHKDEDWYRDMLPRDKFNYWYFPVGDDGPVIMIPRAFEWGGFFSALPEALVDAWYRADPETVKDVLGHLYQNTNPLDLPVPLAVAAEQLANEQFYSDRPIVPMGETFKPPSEQAGPYTSAVAVILGDIFEVSPRRIDHVIRGFLGGVGSDATEAMDQLLATLGVDVPERPQRAAEASDVPIVGRLFRRGGKEGTQSKAVDDFYDRLAEAQQRQGSDRDPETEDERTIRLMLTDARAALSLIAFIRNNTSEQDKRQQLQVLSRRVARTALRTADAGPKAAQDLRAQFTAIRRLNRRKEDMDVESVRKLFEEHARPTIEVKTTSANQ